MDLLVDTFHTLWN